MAGLAKIGMDFGTTNSLLSYYDPKRGPMEFMTADAEAVGIPTVVAAEHQNTLIGLAALTVRGFRRHFKLALGGGVRGMNRAEAREGSKTFHESLFNEFLHSKRLDGFEEIVATVPVSWMRQDQQANKEVLLKIYEELGHPRPRVVTEPVAAGCYFAHRYLEENKRPFGGYALIYDHGGGTLDISLVHIDGTRVTSIDDIGLDKDMTSLGFGGAAFDRFVFSRVQKRTPALAGMDTDAVEDWLIEFERKKRHLSKQIATIYSRKREHDPDLRLCEIRGTPVMMTDLSGVFENEFRPTLEALLKSFLKQCRAAHPNLRINNPEQFQVVAVGGFSEFHPVQGFLRKFFAQESGTSEVIANCLHDNDRWLAISKGACLVAAEEYNIPLLCPFTFGVVSYDGRTPVYNPLMVHREPQSTYKRPKLHENQFGLAKLKAESKKGVTFYIVQNGKPVHIEMGKSFQDVLPDHGRAEKWRFGCSVVDEVVRIRIQSVPLSTDDKPREKTFRMGQFLTLRSGVLDEHEE